MEVTGAAIGSQMVSGGITGFLMGWTARKVVNILAKIVMAIAGIQFMILSYLESTGIIDVNWSELNNSIVGLFSGVGKAGSQASGFLDPVFNFLMGIIPITGGLTIGALLGWKKAS